MSASAVIRFFTSSERRKLDTQHAGEGVRKTFFFHTEELLMDEIMEAAQRMGLRVLANQSACITNEEMRDRIEARRFADANPTYQESETSGGVMTAVAVASARTQVRNAIRTMRHDAPHAGPRCHLAQAEKRLPMDQLHLRRFILKPYKNDEEKKENMEFLLSPEPFDRQLQCLLPQLREGELLVVVAYVLVDEKAAELIYGSRKARRDYRPFMCHGPSDLKQVKEWCGTNPVIFAAMRADLFG